MFGSGSWMHNRTEPEDLRGLQVWHDNRVLMYFGGKPFSDS